MGVMISISMMVMRSVNILLVVVYRIIECKDCCKNKKVGDHTYTFNKTQSNFLPTCLDSCIYTRDGESDTLYCFIPGDEQMECLPPTEQKINKEDETTKHPTT